MRAANLIRVISGGQTGVDRAALDAALACALPCGGWCPRGRSAEDGVIDARYPLRETPSTDYRQRTAWNVRDGDATLILARDGELRGGTRLTYDLARRSGKPYRIVLLEASPDIASLLRWIRSHSIDTLNIAGPRESQEPGIYDQSLGLLQPLCRALRETACAGADRRPSPSGKRHRSR